MKASFLVTGGALRGALARELFSGAEAMPALPEGTVVENYRLMRVIGRGGSSVVYAAERCDGTFDQTVALKVVRADRALRHQMRRERNVLAKMQHPYIASIYDGGELPGGDSWLAMGLVDGRQIDEYCEGGALPIRDRLRLLLKVCDGLDHAHAHMIIHRDIKPSNILVEASGIPKLLDFGIASQASEGGTAAPEERSFTFDVASPEQLEGDTVTTASDVFQIGLLLERLTFGSEQTAAGLARARILAREIRTVVAKATALGPDDRYPSIAALAAELQAILDHRPIAGLRHRRSYVLLRFLHRNAVATAITGGALAAIGILATGAALRVRDERDAAREAAEQYKATSQFLVEIFRTSDPGENRGETLTANEILGRAAQRLATEFGDRATQRAELAYEISSVYSVMGERSRVRQVLQDTLAAVGAADGTSQVAVARLEAALAQHLNFDGETPVAEALLRQAVARMDAADKPNELNVLAYNLRVLAKVLDSQGKFAEALEAIDRSIALLRRTQDAGRLLSSEESRASILHSLGRMDEAAAQYASVLTRKTAALGEDHPHLLGVAFNYALLQVDRGEYSRAELSLLPAIENAERAKANPDVIGIARSLLARSYCEQSRWADCESAARTSIDEVTRTQGAGSWRLGDALSAKAVATEAAGDSAEALRLAQQAYDIVRAGLPEDSSQPEVMAQRLGCMQLRAGQTEVGTQHLKIVLDSLAGATDRLNSVIAIDALLCMATAALERGELAAADASLRRIDARTALLQSPHPTQVASARRLRAQLELRR